MSGRKMVLHTIIESLRSLGHPVVVAYFGPASATDVEDGMRYVALPGPSRMEKISAALGWLFRKTPSLNEGLYQSRRASERLSELVQEEGIAIVVTDMLRTAGYGERLNLPWIADLDDLLSRRYRTMATDPSVQSNILGYYGTGITRLFVRLANFLLPWVLRREAAIIEKREIEVAQKADVASLVSQSEAAFLAEIAGCQVFHTPMAVSGPSALPRQSGRSRELVFLGGLDYGPNLKSVVQFDTEIRPALLQRNVAQPTLHVIGNAGSEGEHRFSEAIALEGYVDDLDTAMQRYKAMLVPQVLPGGVKTKIVVAALNGTVVLAHRTALDGMGLQNGVHVWEWETAEELAQLLVRLREQDLNLEAMAQAAYDWAVENYSAERLRALWDQNIQNSLRGKTAA